MIRRHVTFCAGGDSLLLASSLSRRVWHRPNDLPRRLVASLPLIRDLTQKVILRPREGGWAIVREDGKGNSKVRSASLTDDRRRMALTSLR